MDMEFKNWFSKQVISQIACVAVFPKRRNIVVSCLFGFFRFSDDGSGFRAALLSGPPGVGKTTTSHLVCREAGFSFVELNASDTRSKKSLQLEVCYMIKLF